MPQDLTNEHILSEVRKLQYLYGLKHEIRYGMTRPEGLFTESVAEHIYGMHICAQYFLPLENPDRTWDLAKIYEMITLHDIDEIETGDTIGYLKTAEMYQSEIIAAEKVIASSPQHLQGSLSAVLTEYSKQDTIEAQFVKAIDRFEPLIQVYSDFGNHVIGLNKTTEEQSRRIKESYIKPFPFIYRFNEVVHQTMIDENFFHVA